MDPSEAAATETAVAIAASRSSAAQPDSAVVVLAGARPSATAPRHPNSIAEACIEAIVTPFTLGVTLVLLPFSLLQRRSHRHQA